jgi:hypothetical protein
MLPVTKGFTGFSVLLIITVYLSLIKFEIWKPLTFYLHPDLFEILDTDLSEPLRVIADPNTGLPKS